MHNDISIGQGHGVPDRFAGLPDAYASEDNASIVILPVPFDQTTTYQKGTDKGPAALIEASRNLELYDIETDSEVYLKVIFTDDAIVADSSESMLDAVYYRTQELLNKDKFVVVIGGEHSISYAAIRAYAEHYGKLTVLQFDAHADLQPAYENNPWSHASVMARVKEIPQVSKIVSVGIRSMSKYELKFIDMPHTFFAHEMETDTNWTNRLMNMLEGPIYITFDLDVFDCSLMPSTGTPEPGGLFWNPVMKLLKSIAEEKNIVGFDVVELCPQPWNLAPDYLAAKLTYKLLSYKFFAKKGHEE